MTAPGARTSDYDYSLPPGSIAQHPVEPRDSSRLMVVDRTRETISHRHFQDLAELIPPGDALVVNTSRVMRARLLGTRPSGGAAEIFLLREKAPCRFEALVHPGGKLGVGRVVHIAPGTVVRIVAMTDRRTRIVEIESDLPIDTVLERYGHVPLPPYIQRGDTGEDSARYQTVYARESGSVAAPTAGLHFTPTLLDAIEEKGVRRVEVLLHVGAGTFKPVESDDPGAHVMHEEWFEISPPTANTIADVRARGGKLWVVGTTSARSLEAAATEDGQIRAGARETKLFIRPPYQFRAVDRLITNFHLPRSTLLMLVAAFAGYPLTMRAYREAVERGYRFYSYGDAMLIL